MSGNTYNHENNVVWPAPGTNPTSNLSGGPALPAGIAVKKLPTTGKIHDNCKVWGRQPN